MATVDVNVVRVRNGQRVPALDRAVAEEPLEIRLHKRSFATIMRTPGADRELAAGFLLSERVLQSSDDLGSIELCRDVENVVDVVLAGASAEGLDRLVADRRNVAANASCGACGRLSIDTLASDLPRVPSGFSIAMSTLAGLPDRLRAGQPLFAVTGGLHAAALFDRDGTLRTSAEDVGRHNAVDKIVGRMVMQDALPLSDVVPSSAAGRPSRSFRRPGARAFQSWQRSRRHRASRFSLRATPASPSSASFETATSTSTRTRSGSCHSAITKTRSCGRGTRRDAAAARMRTPQTQVVRAFRDVRL